MEPATAAFKGLIIAFLTEWLKQTKEYDGEKIDPELLEVAESIVSSQIGTCKNLSKSHLAALVVNSRVHRKIEEDEKMFEGMKDGDGQ